MRWHHNLAALLERSQPITNLEAKQEVANRIAGEVKDRDVIGFGSGSTSLLAVQAIGARLREQRISCIAIPTSFEIAFACSALGIPTASLIELKPDWVFDGADEVDPKGDLIKGRGGAMFREKLLIDSSPRTFILVDRSKLVSKLGERFAIPIEIHPEAINLVNAHLTELGASEIQLRLGVKKDGPVITENGNIILDVRFKEIAPGLEQSIKSIVGVIESGLFQGRTIETIVAGA
ncbi:MAG TPA: ribose 5-phosphate isomerase A [Bryobacteraceae bacterium]|nr:ribose 5-phosphate isomerase A [Bryobacteraceae bacterium]